MLFIKCSGPVGSWLIGLGACQALVFMRCRCKAQLLRGSKSAALTKTAQQHAAKLEGILAVAYEAHTNFQTSFTLAVAASTQQLQAGAGQQPLETPYSSHSRTAVLQQRSAAPGSCPGRLQQASCSNPGVELAPRFFTSCGEPTACQQQQLAALQAPLQQALQLSQSIAQAADGELQIKRNVEAQDASTLVANLEAAAGIPQQMVQQDSSEDLVAAALACMPDYQRAWALLQQVWHHCSNSGTSCALPRHAWQDEVLSRQQHWLWHCISSGTDNPASTQSAAGWLMPCIATFCCLPAGCRRLWRGLPPAGAAVRAGPGPASSRL